MPSCSEYYFCRFFAAFDTDRPQLQLAYTPNATFSICVNTAIPERSRKSQHLSPEAVAKQRGLTWSTYLGSSYEASGKGKQQADENLSRNFLRMKGNRKFV
jgi:hypothetical protein